MRASAVLLLSAGLDSSVNLYWALSEGLSIKKVLTFNYGQRATLQENRRAQELCKINGLNHESIDLPWFSSLQNGGALLNDNLPLPQGEEVQIQDKKLSQRSKELVWVPNRNGVFLNVAAAFAESLEANYIIPGFNWEEAQTFPDNSKDYMKSLDKSFSLSTSNGVQVKCYTVAMTKREIVQKGRALGVPFDLLWPCYQGGDSICGECESCQRYRAAMEEP